MSDLRDEPASWRVESSTVHFTGGVISVRTDRVVMPSGEVVARDVVRHPGAVGVIPYDEARKAVLLLRQYRHAPAMLLWEPPAGLRDVADEAPLETAQRELYEEAHLRAERWDVLVDAYTSPGYSDEKLRIYLARDLADADGERHNGEHEEAELVPAWIPLDDAVRDIFAGNLHNPITIMGILALHTALTTDFALRASAPG